jgi:hypothetical protein
MFVLAKICPSYCLLCIYICVLAYDSKQCKMAYIICTSGTDDLSLVRCFLA